MMEEDGEKEDDTMADLDGLDFDRWLEQERQALEQEQPPAERESPRPQGAPAHHAAPQPARQASRRTAPVREVPPPRPPQRRRRGGMSVWMKVLIPVAVLLMAAVIALAVGFTYASRVADIDTIYPNVSVNGVAVGGMTVDEAAKALGDAPDRYANAAVTVSFPTGESVTVTAQDLGLKPADGTGLAQLAYSYGRDGSMLSNLMTYRACQEEPMDIAVQQAAPVIDRGTIGALLDPVAQQVNQKLSTTQAQVSETEITLVKNTGAYGVDTAALTEQIAQAFEREDYAPIEYDITQQSAAGQENGQTVDSGALLQTLYDRIYVEPISAQYDPVTSTVTDSVSGVRFDMEEARQLWDGTAEGGTVVIPLIKEEPEITKEQLSERLFADVLAEKSTTLSGSSSARINNITLAAAAMNGTIIQPGGEFDYNSCLGERTAAKGYQEAGAYENGQHTSAVGGGICQGSSTLYYCTLYANLDILVRYDHYFTVNYLPLGMDATVSWGGPDFRFRNSRNYPIKIEAWVSNGSLTVRILGTDEDGSYVQVTSDTWEDADFYYAQTYRKVYDASGNQISSNQEAYSRYHKHEDVAATATPAPTAPPVTQAPVIEAPPEVAPPVVVEPGPVIPETPVEPETPAAPEAPPATEETIDTGDTPVE